MTNDELKSMLQTWQSPPAPAALRRRVFTPKPFSLRWLFSGDIRVPVPVALAALCFTIAAAYYATRPSVSSLSSFQQVDHFQPRIVRSNYAAN